mgnify:FL=1
MTHKMLNGNWVSKRKRGKHPSSVDKFSGKESKSKTLESPSSTSSQQRLKNENTSDHLSSKIKGNDGVSSCFTLLISTISSCSEKRNDVLEQKILLREHITDLQGELAR